MPSAELIGIIVGVLSLGAWTRYLDSRASKRLDRVEDRINQRIDRVETRASKRFDVIVNLFDGVGRRFEGVARRFEGIETTLRLILLNTAPRQSEQTALQ